MKERPAAVWSKRKHCYVCPSCHQPLYTLTWEGRGRNKRPIQHFMKETAFLKQTASNRKCMNTVQKWNTEKNKTRKLTVIVSYGSLLLRQMSMIFQIGLN